MASDNPARETQTPLSTTEGRERVRVLHELKALLHSFSPQVRQQLLAQIQSVLGGLAR